jgi:hypothetical protein
MSDDDEDDDDMFDEHGILRDGKRWRIPMRMMDAVQRAVAAQATLAPRDSPPFPRPARGPFVTALDGGTAGLHRPGFRIQRGGNRGDQLVRDGARSEIQRAHDEYRQDRENAWRGGVPRDQGQNDGSVEDAYEEYENDLCNAWRNP